MSRKSSVQSQHLASQGWFFHSTSSSWSDLWLRIQPTGHKLLPVQSDCCHWQDLLEICGQRTGILSCHCYHCNEHQGDLQRGWWAQPQQPTGGETGETGREGEHCSCCPPPHLWLQGPFWGPYLSLWRTRCLVLPPSSLTGASTRPSTRSENRWRATRPRPRTQRICLTYPSSLPQPPTRSDSCF